MRGWSRENRVFSLRKRPLLISVLILLFFLSFSGVSFSFVEEFHYDLTYLGFKAGEATLRFESVPGGVRISTRAESAPWISIFYRVDDRAESVIIRETDGEGNTVWYPKSYHLKIREGRHRRDKEVVFSKRGRHALFINHLNGERKEFDLPPGTFDPLSGFFLLRGVDLVPGKSVISRIFDSKKVWDVQVKVLRTEKIDTYMGERKTVVVKPELKSEGIFLRKGDVFIFLTDDERKIPLLLKTRVLVGSVLAELRGGRF